MKKNNEIEKLNNAQFSPIAVEKGGKYIEEIDNYYDNRIININNFDFSIPPVQLDLDSQYYNLIICNNIQIKPYGLFTLESKNALKNFTDYDISSRFARFDEKCKNIIYSIPTLLANPIKNKFINDSTIIGTCQIVNIERQGSILIFAYSNFKQINIKTITNNFEKLKILKLRLNTELSTAHWSIKQCNLQTILNGGTNNE